MSAATVRTVGRAAASTGRSAARAAGTSRATTRPATRAASSRPAEGPSRRAAALRLVPQVPARVARAPFVGVVVGLLALGLLGLLALNTSLAENSFQLHALQAQAKVLADQEQVLRQEVEALQAPEALAGRAEALGMVPGGPPAFLRLSDGKVLGKPSPAPSPSAAPDLGTASRSTSSRTVPGAPVAGAPVPPVAAVPPSGTAGPAGTSAPAGTPSGTGTATGTSAAASLPAPSATVAPGTTSPNAAERVVVPRRSDTYSAGRGPAAPPAEADGPSTTGADRAAPSSSEQGAAGAGTTADTSTGAPADGTTGAADATQQDATQQDATEQDPADSTPEADR